MLKNNCDLYLTFQSIKKTSLKTRHTKQLNYIKKEQKKTSQKTGLII